jgi:manganese oxidase
MMFRCALVAGVAAFAGVPPLAHAGNPSTHRSLPAVVVNDNRQSAGTVENGVLRLDLRAAVGLWRPEGDSGPALEIEALGEAGTPLQVPAPLIRVTEGTEVVAHVRNDLDVPMTVHGLCPRDGRTCAPIPIAPSTARDVRFVLNRAGTFHYWATTTGMPLPFRATGDTQLSGALIVDPVGTAPDSDRIFVVTDWTSLTRDELRQLANADEPGPLFLTMNPQYTFTINGLSWPHTERLTYRIGQPVRWRILNLSSQAHPMHLHGFYYEVESLGDGVRDTEFAEGRMPRVVTQLMPPGATMKMVWRPERVGNWILHCHIADHISPARQLTGSNGNEPSHSAAQTAAGAGSSEDSSKARTTEGHRHENHSSAGMAGLVLGVTIVGPDITPDAAPAVPARKLTLVMQTEPKRYGEAPAYGFVLADGEDAPPADKVTVPGPTLVLHRGEPVELTLVNRLPESTAIHWHGMELESYYDGVHGWSGAGGRVTPLIEPGQLFTVRFTPPQAGTFIYHTHMHDDHQLTSGMYGAMLVLDRGDTFDPALDHVVVIGRAGPGRQAPAILNGSREAHFALKPGQPHRFRFINITADDIFVVSMGTSEGPVTWRPITKDGTPVPDDQSAARPARQTISVGETYDFEYQAPAGRKLLWMDVRSQSGHWEVQGRVDIK